MVNSKFVAYLMVIIFICAWTVQTFALDWSDDPTEIKAYNRQLKSENHIRTIVVKDSDQLPPPTITEWLYKNDFKKKAAVANEDQLPESLRETYRHQFPLHEYSEDEQRWIRNLYRDMPEPGGRASALSFSADIPVRVDSGPERQPSLATGTDGRIYAVWAEEMGSNNAIMFSRSTDAGATWSEAIIVDNVGTNYFPQIAVWGTGFSARVHIVYNYVDIHITTVIDTSGGYLGEDTTFEGDVYYCRSNNGGSSFGHYQAIANNDIDLGDYGLPSIPGIPTAWHYDEGGADITVDVGNNVYISYYAQSDEGHLLNITLWIIYIIAYYLITGEFGLPDWWFDYNWYNVEMRCSSNGGSDFNDALEIKEEWFWNYSYNSLDVYGSGPNAVVHIAYTDVGVAIPLLPPISNGNIYYRKVLDPLYSPSLTSEIGGWVGYVSAGGLEVDDLGHPKIGYTDIISASDFDVWYTHSTDGGATFDSPGQPLAISSADEFEPRLAIDNSNNTFLAWTDGRHGTLDIYTVWTEDGGRTLRPDQHRVNSYFHSDQVVPGIGIYTDDCIRRLDIDWWDMRDDGGDIYYANATWWRTNIEIVLNDTLAHPMGGTVDLIYTSFDQPCTVQVTTGSYIIYHDSLSEITLGQISSGSNAVERWIFSEEGGWSATPSECGNTYTVTYFNQYYTHFTVTKANPPGCPADPPTGVNFQYYYFDALQSDTTNTTTWADIASFYTYDEVYPEEPRDERWFCPSPTGRLMSYLIAPPFYLQWKTPFLTPRKLNNEFCTHSVPGFIMVQRYNAGVNEGGTTPLYEEWTDCGSPYEYEDPKNISEFQRWDITSGSSGTLLGLDPIQPECYHQWTPLINLIGPTCPDNTVWVEAHTRGGLFDPDVGLCGTYTEWTDCGTELTFSEFTTLGWVARDPYSWEHVITMFVASIRYGNVVAITIRNDFGGGRIGVDSLEVSSPYVTGWAPGSDHVITALSPQVFGHTRYIFTHWSDEGAISHTVSTVYDTTFVAYFDLQYLLEIISDYGDPVGGGWYDEGTNASFHVTRYDSAIGGIRHEFEGWVGSGTGSYTGPDTGHTVTMNNPITETANWNTQYYLELDYTGAGPHTPTLTGEGWYYNATHANISADSILGGSSPDDSIRYIFDHWQSYPAGATFGSERNAHTTVYMNRPYRVTAVYVIQYRFCVFNPDAIDTPVPPVGCYWYFNGSEVTGSVTSPSEGSFCLGFTGTGSLRDDTAPEFSFIINAPSSVTWLWGDQFTLEVVDTTGWLLTLAHADPPAGLHYYVPGTSDTATVDETYVLGVTGNRYRCIGYTGRGAIDSGDTNWVEFTMTESSTLEWLWLFEHRFIVRDSIVGGAAEVFYDSPVPGFGTHWYESGTVIVGSITPLYGDYRCVGYDGDGSLSDGVGSGFTFTIGNGSMVTWLWAHSSQVESLVVYSDYGTCVPPGSSTGIWNYFLRDTPVNAWTTLVAPGAPGERHVCTGWTGTGPVPASGDSNSVNFVMNSSGSLTWNWRNQYRLIIANPSGCDAPFPSVGEHWFDEGTMVTCFVTTPDTITPDSIMYCVGFDGSGHSLDWIDRSSTNFSFFIVDQVEVTWIWESYMIPLYIISDYGDPSPSDTTYWIPGSGVTALVNSPHYDATDGIRHLCTGFNGTGSAPAHGTATYVYFVINDTTTITWLWQTQYRLIIEQYSYFEGDPNIYGNPIPTLGEHWFSVGENIRGSVANPDPVVDTMVCVGFYGTGAAPASSPQSEFNIDLTEPSSITWRWYPESMTARLTVVSAHDSPRPWGVTYWLLGETVNAEVDSIVVMGDIWVECIGWHGYGSVDSFGTDNNTSFEIWEETYLVWDWSSNLAFTVLNPRGYGDPVPPVGTYSYPIGSFIEGWMDGNPDWDPLRADSFYCLGYYGTGNLPPVSPQTDFLFTITTPSSITWRWAPSESVAVLDVFSEYGSPHPYGRTYWLIGSTVNANVDEFVMITPGIRAYCSGWIGTGDVRPNGDENNMSFEIYYNSSITWQWDIQYSFTIVNEGGYDTPVPPAGTYWYAESTLVEGYITDNPAGPLDTMFCIGYYGTGSAPERSHQTDFSFMLLESSTLTWVWAGSSSVRRLDVYSDHDNPQPYGTTYWLIGEYVLAQVDSITELVDSSMGYFCTGWTGSGSVDSAGSTYWTDFNIFEHSSITWHWLGAYLIDLTYDGCDEEPYQEGEGWYFLGDTVEIYSETPVYSETEGAYWGFVWWSSMPTGAPIEDTMAARTFIVVDGAYTLTAHYNPAIHHIVRKNPTSDVYGWILIDDLTFDSVSTVSQWWGIGSVHRIGVSDFDSSSSARYQFFEWSDRGEIIHTTEPVPGTHLDTTYRYIAYYTTFFMCPIFKAPLHRSGSIFLDGTEYDSVSSVIAWWLPGTVHEIGVTSPDLEDTIGYFFEEWSDSGDIIHITDTITGPTAFIAYYDTKYRLLIRKEPPQPYGWLLFQRDTVRDTSEASYWIYLDTTYTIEVSEYDMGPSPTYDSIYIFNEWESDAAAPIRRVVGPYDAHAEEVALYLAETFNLSFRLDRNYWDLDTMNLDNVRTMEVDEMIQITNDGNCPIDFGLMVLSVEMLGFTGIWAPGYYPGMNTFTLRVRFDDNPTPPAEFSPSLDFVKSTITWATNHELFPIFGEGGVFIYPNYPLGRHPAPESTENIWMQFLSPTLSNYYGSLVTITVNLIAKPHLP
ncbi:hypothetical protein JW877_05235 [bacterium]|nr:hypothetical protein [bacterium]